MISVAQIAAMAFDAVGGAIEGVIQSATLTRITQGTVYDPVTGTYPEMTETFTGRAVFSDEKAMADAFPTYVIGPADRMLNLEGFNTVPKETDTLTVGDQTLQIVRVGDVVGVGQFFNVIARNA